MAYRKASLDENNLLTGFHILLITEEEIQDAKNHLPYEGLVYETKGVKDTCILEFDPYLGYCIVSTILSVHKGSKGITLEEWKSGLIKVKDGK